MTTALAPALPPLVRAPNWDTGAFHDFLLARADTPFAWGGNDCALFAADGILAITGVDIASAFRGKYKNAGQARVWMAAVTGIAKGDVTVADAVAFCARVHGLEELKHPLMAQRGDLVVLPESGRLIAGLVHLSGRHVVAVGESGLKRLSIETVERAWHY